MARRARHQASHLLQRAVSARDDAAPGERQWNRGAGRRGGVLQRGRAPEAGAGDVSRDARCDRHRRAPRAVRGRPTARGLRGSACRRYAGGGLYRACRSAAAGRGPDDRVPERGAGTAVSEPKKRPGFWWMLFYSRRRRGFPWLLAVVLVAVLVLALLFAIPPGFETSRTVAVLLFGFLIVGALAFAVLAVLRPRRRRCGISTVGAPVPT